ncbi:MAG: ABC transporter permease [Bryobacteraceae bacterium]
MLHNLRFALRQIARAPGFAALACITLAVGIGISAAMFAVLQTTLLRPIPYAHPGRLVILQPKSTQFRNMNVGLTYPELLRWRKRDSDLRQIGYYHSFPTPLDEKTSSQLILSVSVSANLFRLLGIKPILGRGFTKAEQQPGHNYEAVLPEQLWREKFHADPSVLGSTIRLGGQPYTVIGIMPRSFAFPRPGEKIVPVWVPYELTKDVVSGKTNLANAVARLRPDISADAAARNLSAIQRTLHKQDPKKYVAEQVSLQSYRDSLTKGSRPALLALAAAVGLVWLIASTNVAALMLTRVHGRRQELAIRSALGAGTFRILVQLLTESLSLCVIACLFGVALCAAALKLFGHTLQSYAASFHFSPDMLLLLIGATVLSAILVTVPPVLHVAASPIVQGLHESSWRSGMSRRQNRVRDLFVILQVALSVLLLVSCGMMLRTLYNLRNVPLGFQPSHVLTTSFFIPQKEYAKRNIVPTFYEPLLTRLRAIPGVQGAAISSVLPVNPHFRIGVRFGIAGRPKRDEAHKPQGTLRIMSPNLDSLLGVSILRGRPLTDRDTASSAPVAVVNQALVRRYFPHGDPLGHQVQFGKHTIYTIVGVTADVHQSDLNQATVPEIDLSYLQVTPKDGFLANLISMFMQLAVRTEQNPKTIIPQVRSILHNINPDLALNPFITMEQQVDNSFGNQTLAGRLLMLFAAIALLIAGAGLYSLLAYSVSQRRHEIGIRIALGAQRGQVLRMVFTHAVAVTGIGIAIGLIGSWFAARTLESFLYGVPPHDWHTMLAVAAILLAISMLAAYLPARSAASVDPMIALRAE